MNPMKVAALALALAGCGIGSSDGVAPPPGDAGGIGCEVALSFDPKSPPPIAGPTTKIRVSAFVTGALGVIGYNWHVQLGAAAIATTPAQADGSAIDFLAPVPGAYEVSLTLTGAPTSCLMATLPINVGAPGARSERLRLRVVPGPTDAAPPHEEIRTIAGGADFDLGIITVDPGVPSNILVTGPSGGVPAYVRLAPSGAPDAIVEAFTSAMGQVMTYLLPQPHTVLVVPSVAGSAPRRVAGWSGATLVVDAGAAVGGQVLGPGGAALAGATIRLSIDGVPSTVSTTAADGSFTVRAVTDGIVAGTTAVTVEVTPPGASGLPRLSATSAAFDLTAPLQIRYAPGLALLKDLAGTRVRRQGAPVASASVMVVGALPVAGTIAAGTSATATGEIRIATRASATGTLPSTLVPPAVLSAVITVAPGDLAVAALDTTAALPVDLDSPPMQAITASLVGPSGAKLPFAVLDLVPAGALALAAAPVLHVTADGAGMLAAALAAGGHYDLRLRDPGGRAAPLTVTNQVAAMIDRTTFHLPVALQLHGKLMLGGTQALPNASIQILCDACTGIDRARPIAEGASDGAGQFTLAVPDPGTM